MRPAPSPNDAGRVQQETSLPHDILKTVAMMEEPMERILMTMPTEYLTALDELARRNAVSRSEMVRRMIRQNAAWEGIANLEISVYTHVRKRTTEETETWTSQGES